MCNEEQLDTKCRITEWFVLEGTLWIILFQPRAMGTDPFHQPRLLKAPSNLALDTAREGAATASLGNLCQGLTTLRVKNFFLIARLNLTLFQLEAITPCSVTTCSCKKHLSGFLVAYFKY